MYIPLKLISLLLLPLGCDAQLRTPKVSKVRKHENNVAHDNDVPYPAQAEYKYEEHDDGGTSMMNKSKRPNILLIFADDVGTEDIPGFWGTNLAPMPNLQKLQAEGVTFFNAHASPLCAPSRYMLLSGNYQHRGNKVPSTWNFFDGENQFRAGQKSIAHALKEGGGYHSAMIGKWHIGLKLPNGGRHNRTNILTATGLDWTFPVMQGPNDVGFDYSYYTSGGIQEAPYSFFRNGFLETDPSNIVFWPEGNYEMEHGLSAISRDGEGDPNWDSTAYNMILVNETNAFLDFHMENRKDDPFFAYVALGSVHIPHSPPRQYLDGSPVAGENMNLHLDMLFEMDKVIGSLVDSIEQRGLANDTIIIFASDNGGINARSYANRKLRGHKGTIYEGGHRIPLIMRYDGHFPKADNRTTHFVGLNDLYATLAELANITIPEKSAQDSVSFANYLYSEDNSAGLRDHIGVWRYKKAETGRVLDSETLLYKDLKIIKKYRPKMQLELYDLNQDLGEKNNQIDNTEHQKTVQHMLKMLERIGPCPIDVPHKFTLTSGNEMGQVVDCDWFARNKHQCSRHIEGELNCNSVCGRFDAICRRR